MFHRLRTFSHIKDFMKKQLLLCIVTYITFQTYSMEIVPTKQIIQGDIKSTSEDQKK